MEWKMKKYFIFLGGLLVFSIVIHVVLGKRNPPRFHPLVALAMPFVAVFLLPYSMELTYRALRSFAPEPVDSQWLASQPLPKLQAALSGCIWQEFGNVLAQQGRQHVADYIIERDLHRRRLSHEVFAATLQRIVLAHDPLAEDYLSTITHALKNERKRRLLLSCAQTTLRKAS